MHNSKIKQISLAVCLALMPLAAEAAGLGRMTVLSGLGEPLNAEIELLSATQEELASLSARIAPAETYAEQGVDRTAALGGIVVELGKKPDGSPVLKLRSPQPLNEPFLDMLIQVEWSSGRLLREYTALLDPPGYGDQPQAGSATPVLSNATIEQAAPQAPVEKKSGARKHKTSTADSAAPAETPTDEYKTRSGDTLHAIAERMQVEGVSLEQMLVGLYRGNQQAFSGDNMNRLKVGQIIRVPDAQELQAISQQEAAKEIRVQAADWNAYRSKLAEAVAQSEAVAEEKQAQSASGKITAAAEDKAAPPVTGPRDVVKLSKSEAAPTKAGAPDAKAADVQAKLNSMQEEATAREKAVKDANERIASLEKQIQDMQKLLQVKNQTLADMQQKSSVPPAAPEKPVEATPAAQPVATPPAAEAVPAEVKPEIKPEAPVAEVKKPKKLLKPKPQPKEQSKPESGMLGALAQDPLVAGGVVGGVLLLLGGVWFYLRNKRRKGLDSFEQGILTTGGLKPNTVFGNTAGGTVDTGDTSFLTDFSQGAGGGMIDTNDVDPIAEAEVYMAYGRDVQAEEILKDAISKEPKRYELHQKLLEIYANRKDTSAFETLAGELYSTLGSTDPHWAKVAEMGAALEPGNPLYSASAAPAARAVSDSGATAATSEAETPSGDNLEVAVDLGGEPSLDFSLDISAPAEERPVAATDDASLDFDLGSLSADEVPVQAETMAEPELPEISAGLDFELPSATPSEAESAAEVPSVETAAPMEDAGLDFQFDLPEPAAEESVQLEAAEIGLELPPVVEASSEPALEMPSLELPVAEDAAAPAAGVVETTPVEEPASVADMALELPEIGVSESVTEAAPEPVEEISFELPTAEEMAESAPSQPQMEAAPEADDLDISFDLPLDGAADVAAETNVTTESPEPQLAAEDLEKTMIFQAPDAEVEAADIVFDVPAEPATDAGDLDFNFDVDLGSEVTVAEEKPQSAATALPDLDLSGISLDLDEGASTADAEAAPAEEITLSASESPDVDTKLDLVTAYMDMGDTEGARELLEEVLKEGGPQQRERAQSMLDSLG